MPITTVKDRLVLKKYPFFRELFQFRTFPALVRGCQAGYRICSATRLKVRVFPFFDYLAIRPPISGHDVFWPELRPTKSFLTILIQQANHSANDRLPHP
jgi:hypothetical protein